MASADESSRTDGDIEDQQPVTADDAIEVLEEHDGDPKALLDHREIPYILAEWLYNNDWQDTTKYQTVEDEIEWRSGDVMPKGRFTDTLENIWNEMVEEEEEQKESDIPEMDPDEFYDAFYWDRMRDREIARKCHLWCKENAHIAFSNEQVFVYDENEGIWVPAGAVSVVTSRSCSANSTARTSNGSSSRATSRSTPTITSTGTRWVWVKVSVTSRTACWT